MDPLGYTENKAKITVFISKFLLSITKIDQEKSKILGPQFQISIIGALVFFFNNLSFLNLKNRSTLKKNFDIWTFFQFEAMHYEVSI